MFRKSLLPLGCLLVLSAPTTVLAATYTVGPTGRQYTQLSQLFDARNLAPGDVVLVDGSAVYDGDIVMGEDDGGAAGNPVVVRWSRAAGTTRPVLQGGTHTFKFERANHVVFEGFEVRGGSRTCVFSEADDITVRDSIIHDCPSHGILGADNNSGSFTLEYSELYNSGAGTTRHTIYMQSDEIAFPNALFVMRYNYVHDGTGGVLVRVRHQRSQIYYNWIENAVYGEMELIGPDCETQQPGWTADLKREDADVVGNVIIHRNSWRNAIRAGGDLNGRSQGRVRLVNNTIVFDRGGAANAVMVQLGLESLEMHNNVIYQTASGSTPAIVRENPASEVDTPYCGPMGKDPWTSGRKVFGTSNWVQSGASLVPYEWTGTLSGSDPRFTALAQYKLRPAAGSPLLDAGSNAPPAPPAFPYPSPLSIPRFEPPQRAKMAMGGAVARPIKGSRIDIGAMEGGSSASAPIPLNGAQPLLPPRAQGTAGGGTAAVAQRQGADTDRAAPAEPPQAQELSWWQRIWRWLERLLQLQ